MVTTALSTPSSRAIPNLCRFCAAHRGKDGSRNGARVAGARDRARSHGMSAVPKVLLVEDQFELRDLLCDVLQDMGMDVRTADDGQAAMRIPETWSCDALFSDIPTPAPADAVARAAPLPAA